MGERKRFKPPFLREWRRTRDLTQERLAERVGCSVALISMIERGERQYDQEFLEAAAEALNTTPDRLLRINPLDPRSEDTIFETVRRIPLEDRPKALAVLEAFSRKPAANDAAPEPAQKPAKKRSRKRPAA